MKNKDYWQKRFKQLEKAQYNTSSEHIKEIQKQFIKAERIIQNKIYTWFMRFADNNKVTFVEANRLLKNDELEELKWNIDEYISYGIENSKNQKWLKELENASAKVHISRLQALQLQCQQEIENLYTHYDNTLDKGIKEAYTNRYYKTAYEIQLGTGKGQIISGLNTRLVDNIIHKPWAIDEKNFSERIWNDKTKLVNTLHNSLTRMCIVGEGPDKSIKEVADKMHVSRQQAARVVQTEVAAFTAKAQEDCFKDLDVEQFEVVETLDNYTCPKCAKMDGKHLKMKEYKVGITVPPFHPNCRGCTAPYFDDEFDTDGERVARDKDSNLYYVPANMTYEEWKKEYVEVLPQNVIMKIAKDLGIKGVVNINPKQIELKDYLFDEQHINSDRKHIVTRQEAESFMKDAKVSLTRWNGRFVNYYGEKGAVYIDVENKIIRTAFKRNEYDDKTNRFVEEIANAIK